MTRLKSITFKNFKVFNGESYTIDFSNADLIILDGPNGYGKTSVFDAIELAITGNIQRLIPTENRQNPTDIVVAHNGSDDVEVRLELFSKDESNFTILRKLRNPLPTGVTKISRFTELWQTFHMADGQWIATEGSLVNSFFHSRNFSRDFHLFHYIQQEESAHFLKSNNETQRAEQLSQLFGDTKKSEDNYAHLSGINKQIEGLKKDSWKRITDLRETHKITSKGVTSAVVVQHEFLLPWLADSNKSPEWDREITWAFPQEKLNIYLKEIENIKNIIQFKDYFLRQRKHTSASLQKDILIAFVRSFKLLNLTDNFFDQHQKNDLIRKANFFISTNDYRDVHKAFPLAKVFSILNIEGSETFEKEFNDLIEEEKLNSGANELYAEILHNHKSLQIKTDSIPDLKECLLCGTAHPSHSDLLHSVTKHGDFLRSLLNHQGLALVTRKEKLNIDYIVPLRSKITEFLKSSTSPTETDIKNLNFANENKSRLEALERWLTSEKITYHDLLLNALPTSQEQDLAVTNAETLADRILSACGQPTEEYLSSNPTGTFDRIFSEYFLNKQELLSVEVLNATETKNNYITSRYFNSLQDIISEISKLEEKYNTFKRAQDEINEILAVVQQQIRKYRKKLITDIEIPFYLYSGKILQTHQAGLGQGVLIKDPTGGEELKNVRLVSNWKSDHDVLNTMSSGQISAVVIALTLALNKVYSTSLSTILIDDPVQTMDDINMSSLVELLRNDFSDRQIILSTHEDKASKYFTYKYLKHGNPVKKINLMQREEYIPSGNYLYD